MDQNHILIVDDDDRIRKLLSQYLQQNNYIVTTASNTDEAKKALAEMQFDLVILDVMLPGENGTDFARAFKKTSEISILMLTALSETHDRISGLESGADDYLPKPFEPKELLLRISKLISRSKLQRDNIYLNSDKVINLGNVKFIPEKNLILKKDKKIGLSTNESKLLNYLITNKQTIVSREKLSNIMSNVNLRSVDVQITRLRNKIENNPKNPIIIQSVRGQGYILYVS
jgi:two-component system phosphate regulon response regulator OmpR